MLHRRNEPFQYRLSARNTGDGTPELLLFLSEQSVEALRDTNIVARRVEHLLKSYPSLSEFTMLSREGTKFGFNSALEVVEAEDNGVTLIIPIPCLINKKCGLCGGDGEDFSGFECRGCDGSGVRAHVDYGKAFSVTASLGVVFRHLRYLFPVDYEGCKTAPFQLLKVETSNRPSKRHGSAICGEFSELLVKWLPALSDEDLLKVADTMASVWSHLAGDIDLWRGTIGVQFLGGQLFLSVPGDACEILSYPSFSEEGHEFSSHNTDRGSQQLTLLAGLAALTDLAVRDGVG